MPTRPTHRFIATYKGRLAGVVVMATPNSFSNLLGSENKHLEKLISRGACISWSPKNLGSSLVMFAVRYMARHTSFRLFTAYSDTEARELGTIYQACNFTYLGQSSGARNEFFDPANSARGWFSDRQFRKSSQVKRYAKELNITWEKSWSAHDKILWDHIPIEIKSKLKEKAKVHKESCQTKSLSPKHKYLYILGASKKETKRLRGLFKEINPELVNLTYPKDRGPILARPSQIEAQELTKRPDSCWPSEKPEKKFYSIKEVSLMYGISLWLLYEHVKSDPSFPVVNVGLKKKFVIDPVQFESWLKAKTQKFKQAEHHLPSARELLEA